MLQKHQIDKYNEVAVGAENWDGIKFGETLLFLLHSSLLAALQELQHKQKGIRGMDFTNLTCSFFFFLSFPIISQLDPRILSVSFADSCTWLSNTGKM